MNANLLNRHDCAVEMDAATIGGNPSSRRWPLCFYAHELAVEK